MLTKLKLALAVSGSLLAGVVGIAAAHPGGAGKAELIKKYDANGDGKLDDAERATLKTDMKAKREAMKQKVLARFDTNKDGKLDQGERAVMKDELATEAFKKIDVNGDGQI